MSQISENPLQKNEKRLKVMSLLNKLNRNNTVFIALPQQAILQQIEAVNKFLQKVNIDLNTAVKLNM